MPRRAQADRSHGARGTRLRVTSIPSTPDLLCNDCEKCTPTTAAMMAVCGSANNESHPESQWPLACCAYRRPRGGPSLQDRPGRPRAARGRRPWQAPYDRSHPCARGLAQDPTQRPGRTVHPRLPIRTVTTERIGPRAVSRLVQARANEAGFEGIPITGHSLRAGHATTTAAVNGAPIDRIAAQTRHRDLGTLFNHYIRPAEALATTINKRGQCSTEPTARDVVISLS